ncbi:MAG: ribonuclease III [Anaerolineae bacterium]
MALNFDEREIEPAADLARRLGLPFTRLSLLTRALTHRSYVNEHPEVLEDNERLEFLGDAVLDFIAGAWVYHRFPEMPEGDLTKMRSALVRNDRLAAFARRLEISRALRLGRGEFASGGRGRDGLLGSAFEAIIGALYLEAGISAVEAFIHPLFEEAYDSILNEVYDPKSMFQEWAQSQKLGTPHYHTISAHGPDHAKIFEVEVEIGGQVYGRGSGPSKQAAEHAAAQNAMENLGLK